MYKRMKWSFLSMGFLHAALIVTPQIYAINEESSLNSVYASNQIPADKNQNDRYHNRYYFRQHSSSTSQQPSNASSTNSQLSPQKEADAASHPGDSTENDDSKEGKKGETDQNDRYHNGYYFHRRYANGSKQSPDSEKKSPPHLAGINSFPDHSKQKSNACANCTRPHLTAGAHALYAPNASSHQSKQKSNACANCTRPHLIAGAHALYVPNAESMNLSANTSNFNHIANPPLKYNAVRDEDNYYYFYRQPEMPTNLNNPHHTAYSENIAWQQLNGENNTSSNPTHIANPHLDRNAVRDEDNYYYFYRQPEMPTNLNHPYANQSGYPVYYDQPSNNTQTPYYYSPVNPEYPVHTANPPLDRNQVRDEDNYYYFYRQPERPENLGYPPSHYLYRPSSFYK